MVVKSLRSVLRLNYGSCKVRTKSSAARVVPTGKGVGGVKHFKIQMLWLEENTQQNELIIEKVNTMVNWSDALTKYLSAHRLNTLMKGLNL